jgi:hypothetical protein
MVSEEVTGLRILKKLNYNINVQDVGGRVKGANNKLDVILHGAHFALFDYRCPFNWFSSLPIQVQMNLLGTEYAKTL